jgi:flagellar M-ring protein FliF
MPNVIAQMPNRSKAILAASAVGILFVAFMLFKLAAAPSYTTMRTGLDPAETGKITSALDEAGIGYELQNNGTALAVEKSKTAQAQVALAEGGLGGASKKPGYELLKEQKLGASDFQQRQTYQRALEGELANTIGQIDGVSGAEVRLTLPEDELFADETKPATAAVLLSGGATELESASVRGIANLVASSVEGLKAENVTITDATGRMIWPTGEAGADGMTIASKTAAEARYANQVESSINALLLRTVGDGKAQVKVTADLDVDQVKQKQLKYDRRGTPVEEVEETEQLDGGGGAPGTGAGTRANMPTYNAATGGAAGAASNYEKRSTRRTTAVGKTIIDSVRAPGTVNRLDVALVLDKDLEPQKTEIMNLVAGAAGLQEEERGDQITASVLDFAEQPKAEDATSAGPVPAGAVDVAKYAALGLASAIFLFFVGRHLRRREDEALMGEPLWLRQIEAPQSLSALEAAHNGNGAHGPDGTPVGVGARETVEEALRKEPEKVAGQVRTWLSEDM